MCMHKHHAEQDTKYREKCRCFPSVQGVRLRQDFTEIHIQHGTGCKAQADCKSHLTHVADPVPRMPPTTMAAPLKAVSSTAFPLVIPAAKRGAQIAIPSGTLWIPIKTASVMAGLPISPP